MRIVYLTHQYLPRHVGGTEVYTHGLAVRAKKAGHDVRVITHVESASLDRADYKAVSTTHDDLEITEIHHNLSRADDPARAEFDNPEIGNLLRPVLDAARPDLIHALHGMKLSGAALKVCYERQLPVILTLVDYWFICPRHTLLRWNHELCSGPAHDLDCLRCLHELHGFANGRMQKLPPAVLRIMSKVASGLSGERLPRFWRDLEAIRGRQKFLREIVDRADCVVALSEFQKLMYVRNGYQAEKIRVVHHGLETDGLKPSRPGNSQLCEIVFIGSLVYHKGVHILLEALARRPKAKVRLLIYADAGGSNDYVDSIKQLAARDERVRLMGTFPIGEMGRVLETAHALAMPALWYENEPLVVKAAQYMGLPVLASDLGTLATSIRHGANGWRLPAGDVEAWANAIESFQTIPLEPDGSIKSMDRNAAEMLELYQEVYSQSRQAHASSA